MEGPPNCAYGGGSEDERRDAPRGDGRAQRVFDAGGGDVAAIFGEFGHEPLRSVDEFVHDFLSKMASLPPGFQ